MNYSLTCSVSDPYIMVVVRAKKDRDSLSHVLEHYYRSWNSLITIITLGGTRDSERAAEQIRDLARENPYSYIIVLVGREDYRDLRPLKLLEHSANVAIHAVRTAHIRNMRPLEVAVNLEKAKARLRLRLTWFSKLGSYELGCSIFRSGLSIEVPPHPLYDMYFVIGRRHSEVFMRYLRAKLPPVFLVIKRVHDEHDVIIGSKRVAELVIPENDEPYARSISHALYKRSFEQIDLKCTVELSAHHLLHHEQIAKKLLYRAYEIADPDRVIVPWSGGKDSTAALLLALRTFGKNKVTPIFVDTGLEIPLNYYYVEHVCKLLGINPEVEHAMIDRELERRELPTHENRWCTRLKIGALYRAIRRISDRPLIVVGDRDSESLLRLKRPPLRKHEEYLQVAPLKLWSSAMVQMYILLNKVPINPLYQVGFYRLGCYICPAYRVWELNIAEQILREEAENLFRSLLEEQSCLIYRASLP